MPEAKRVSVLLVAVKQSEHGNFVERVEVLAVNRGRAYVIVKGSMRDADLLPLEPRQVFETPGCAGIELVHRFAEQHTGPERRATE